MAQQLNPDSDVTSTWLIGGAGAPATRWEAIVPGGSQDDSHIYGNSGVISAQECGLASGTSVAGSGKVVVRCRTTGAAGTFTVRLIEGASTVRHTFAVPVNTTLTSHESAITFDAGWDATDFKLNFEYSASGFEDCEVTAAYVEMPDAAGSSPRRLRMTGAGKM